MHNSYVALDIETTGLNPKYERILEIGAVRVRDGKVVGSYESIVRAGVKIPSQITRLTGITDEMLKEGKELKQVMEEFHEFCGEDILLGHNISFDFSFIKKALVNMGISFEKSAIDTLKIARVFLPELEKRSLEYLSEYFSITTKSHHRAYDDALAASDLYQILLERFYPISKKEFEPRQLVYEVKKEAPITPRQKTYLKDLLHYHKITSDVEMNVLTKNEASRMIDKIILEHGRIL